MTPTTLCPTCRKNVPASMAERPRCYPFCSDRCQMVDLGRWFNEEYRISEPLVSPEDIEKALEQNEGADPTEATDERKPPQ
jgi:endogenous inhibitor of DNA gyrase (YacG/DUF329 family)